MALNIKSDDTEALAREVARRTGESLTRAVQVALTERLARLDRGDASVTARAARLLEIGRDAAPRWQEPQRSSNHGDLLYDEAGLPR
jgi:antitoxin VapB